MSKHTDSDDHTDSIELADIEDIGVAKGDGESWPEVAERLRGRDDDRWHYCVCGARFRSRGPALLCCSERFADEELVTDGGQSLSGTDRRAKVGECVVGVQGLGSSYIFTAQPSHSVAGGNAGLRGVSSEPVRMSEACAFPCRGTCWSFENDVLAPESHPSLLLAVVMVAVQSGEEAVTDGDLRSVAHVQEGYQGNRYRRDESVQQNRDRRSLPEDDDRHSKAEERRHEENEGVQAALEGICHVWAIKRFADKPDVIRSVACSRDLVTEHDGQEIVTDGGTPTATETEHYADGSFVTCPDCGGDLTYQNPEVVICPDCDAEFSHFYADNGTNELCRAPDMERVTTVYDPDDDQREGGASA